MADENKRILELLLEGQRQLADKHDETQRSVANLDKKLDLHIQKTELELRGINELDAIQNKLLDQHIEGVNTLKRWADGHETANSQRFQKLEEKHAAPRKWLKTAAKIIVTLGALATASAALKPYIIALISKG